jgi:2-polyprenyl-6-methoxyphenol hydroxylase-like FAD-dependent oxidoreductase
MGLGWESRDIVAAIDSADHFSFDLVCQVRTERWTSGRIALAGDAAFCRSLVASEGASLGMAAAYILAGELKKADGDHAIAFRISMSLCAVHRWKAALQ